MLITQPTNASDDDQNTRESILRISKSDMSREIDFEIPVQRYQGPKIVPMPDNCSKKSVLPLKVLCSAIFSERRAKELDIAFLRDVTNNEACPEYNGYNTMATRSFDAAKDKGSLSPSYRHDAIRPRHNNDGSSRGEVTNQRTRPEECHFHKRPTTI